MSDCKIALSSVIGPRFRQAHATLGSNNSSNTAGYGSILYKGLLIKDAYSILSLGQNTGQFSKSKRGLLFSCIFWFVSFFLSFFLYNFAVKCTIYTEHCTCQQELPPPFVKVVEWKEIQFQMFHGERNFSRSFYIRQKSIQVTRIRHNISGL